MLTRIGKHEFPYFFVGTFIEALQPVFWWASSSGFPYFFVGTFIEAHTAANHILRRVDISLLFRRDFH